MLSPDQLDDFSSQGFLTLANFWDKATCERLKIRMQQLIEEDKASIPGVSFSTVSNAHTKSDYFHQSADKVHYFMDAGALDEQGHCTRPVNQSINKVGHGLHVVDEVFKQASFDPRIQAICHQLGFERVGLLQSMYLFKQPTIGEQVDWHQDSTFLYVEDSDVVGFWVALEDATIENGCLQVIPGPHSTPLKRRMVCDNDETSFVEYDTSPWDVANKVDVEVKQGSLVMLHGRLPHASGPNKSDNSRHAYALHVIDSSKHYCEKNWLQWPGRVPEMDPITTV